MGEDTAPALLRGQLPEDLHPVEQAFALLHRHGVEAGQPLAQALLGALTGWDNAVVMPPRCDVCRPDLAGVGWAGQCGSTAGVTAAAAVAGDGGRRRAAPVAQRLQACFGGGRSSEVGALGRHTEASRAEFAA